MQGKDNKKKDQQLKLKDIPAPLRDKYKNHPLFQKQAPKKQYYQV